MKIVVSSICFQICQSKEFNELRFCKEKGTSYFCAIKRVQENLFQKIERQRRISSKIIISIRFAYRKQWIERNIHCQIAWRKELRKLSRLINLVNKSFSLNSFGKKLFEEPLLELYIENSKKRLKSKVNAKERFGLSINFS